MRVLAGLLFAVLALAATPAFADERDRCGLEWTAMRGSVSPGTRCAVVILTADAAVARGDSGSTGRMQWDGSIAGRRRFALTVQRLSAGPATIDVEVAGGYLLLAEGRVGLYVNEPAWAADGWRPWPAALATRRLSEPMRVEVELDGAVVIARLDGIEAGRWSLPRALPTSSGALVVWLNGPRGQRQRLRVSDWQVR